MVFSDNDYDWLGHGMYFWENSLKRAEQWAQKGHPRNMAEGYEPAVVGCVIDLGRCLDFLEAMSLELLRTAYNSLVDSFRLLNLPLPENSSGSDRLLRRLDCAVIERIHQIQDSAGQPPFDSVRAAFWEGEEPYPGAGFKDRNHLQICFRNPNCLKGFFLPRESDGSFQMP